MGLFKRMTERVKRRITKGKSKTQKKSSPASGSKTMKNSQIKYNNNVPTGNLLNFNGLSPAHPAHPAPPSMSRNVFNNTLFVPNVVVEPIKKSSSNKTASRTRTMKNSRSKRRTLRATPPPPSKNRDLIDMGPLFDPFSNSSSNMTASQAKRAFPHSPFAQYKIKQQALNNAANGNAELKKVTQQALHNVEIELNKKKISKESIKNTIEEAFLNIFTTAAKVRRIPYPK